MTNYKFVIRTKRIKNEIKRGKIGLFWYKKIKEEKMMKNDKGLKIINTKETHSSPT